MTPQVAYMQTIGLETLDARYRVQSSNALELAKKLRSLPQIKYVNYVGLEDNPYHELAQRQFGKTVQMLQEGVRHLPKGGSKVHCLIILS